MPDVQTVLPRSLPRRLLRTWTSLVAGLLAACAPADEGPPPVLVVGIDGLEWNVMLPMLERGELPNLAALMERGSYGTLATFQPTLSPIVWTSIATGRKPMDHGILGFSKPLPPGSNPADLELFDNSDRRAKAIWNVASDAGRRVAVVGWWMTFPVEPVNGLMVAQTNSNTQVDTSFGRNIWKGGFYPGVPGQVWPEEVERRIVGHAERAAERLDGDLLDIFGAFPHPLTPLGKQLWENTRWSFQADSTYLNVAEEVLASRGDPYDLVCVYFGGPDVVGHRFWRYYRPDEFEHAPTAAELDNLGGVVEAYYRWTDRALGRLLAAAGEEHRVVVVSDHGMHAVNRSQVFDAQNVPANVNSGHHMTAPAGVWIAAGPDLVDDGDRDPATLRRSDVAPKASVYDVASTVLALLDLPAGADFAGRTVTEVLDPAFLAAHPPRTVPTHDTPAFLASREELRQVASDANADAKIQQLKDLGYIGEDSVEAAVRER